MAVAAYTYDQLPGEDQALIPTEECYNAFRTSEKLIVLPVRHKRVAVFIHGSGQRVRK